MTKTERVVHPRLNQQVTAIGGWYALVQEARLPYQGREILYWVGYGAFDTTCCGVGGCGYALVAGFVIEWKREINTDGLPVSVVEPIRDEATQTQVRKLIQKQQMVQETRFQ